MSLFSGVTEKMLGVKMDDFLFENFSIYKPLLNCYSFQRELIFFFHNFVSSTGPVTNAAQ